MTNTQPQTIDSFDGNYAFLSNFHDVPVTYNNATYLNSEAAFQAQKCPERYAEFLTLKPGVAKRLGRKVQMRPEWNDIRDDVMYDITKAKFTQNTQTGIQLVNTGNAELIEGNYWNDRYWGVCRGVGLNKLGHILMRVRKELRTEQEA